MLFIWCTSCCLGHGLSYCNHYHHTQLQPARATMYRHMSALHTTRLSTDLVLCISCCLGHVLSYCSGASFRSTRTSGGCKGFDAMYEVDIEGSKPSGSDLVDDVLEEAPEEGPHRLARQDVKNITMVSMGPPT